MQTDKCVTPCVGVWIEILRSLENIKKKTSLPAWECGLKWEGLHQKVAALIVTPCVGVWIEILYAGKDG